ncbi:hypothetical protein [Mesorhizobium sp. M0085]|uniref:hypothetical protein n=1 Tax=Mesorhizobium sp. M0085 TaxID=2956872 RepID=UPI00333897E6
MRWYEANQDPERLLLISEMEPEDGLTRVYGPADEETIAFTAFGIEQLQELIAIYRDQTADHYPDEGPCGVHRIAALNSKRSCRGT